MMNLKNTLKKAGLLTSIATIGSIGLATQAQASIYARSYMDIDNLTITSDPAANSPVAGTFNFSLTNTAFLNGSPGSIGGATCSGTVASNNCGASPVLDAAQASENSPVGENDYSFNGPGGLEYSRADSIINAAQLATATATDTQNIAESELQTGVSANANSEILSTTGLTFNFNVAGPTTLTIAFDALVDMLAQIDDPSAANAAAQSVVSTQFRLSNDDTGHFLEWDPTNLTGSCADVTDLGGNITCSSTSASADLNSTIGVSTVPFSTTANTGSGAFKGVFLVNATGDYTLTLGVTTSTLITRTPIPEPASLLLLGTGLMGLGFARRRKVAA